MKTTKTMVKTTVQFDAEFSAAIKIGDIFHEIAKKHNLWAQDLRHESVNPFYNRIEQGLFLEFYYGVPNKLWTPWGQYRFCGSAAGNPIDLDRLTGDLFERVGRVPFLHRKTSSMGEFGPVDEIVSLDGLALPKARVSNQVHGFEVGFYEASKADWAARVAALRAA